MKKKLIFIILTVFALIISAFSTSYGDDVSATMTGNEILRAGDTLKVTYRVENVKCYGFQGNITYNSDIMTLVSAKAIAPHWVIELLGEGKFIAYSKLPVDTSTEFSGGEIFSFDFLISDGATAEDTASIELFNVVATDAQEEIVVPDAQYSMKISPPKSADATISTLFINNASYSPGFSPDVTEYTIPMGVGYDITSLDIDVKTTHEKASYTIEGNDLAVGNNKVSIKVTAEDGTEKVYNITLRRAHAPTEKLSSNTKLSSLTISSGTLSPAFSPDIREYIVYLSNEIESFTAFGVAEDEFARGVENVDAKLVEGVNRFNVSCRAEDGTLGQYSLWVVVMPEYIGIVPTIKNTIPIIGRVDLVGEYKIGSTLTAKLVDGYSDTEYSVSWYKNSELVSTGESYTVTEGDKESVIKAVITGKGFFSGSIEGDGITVLKSGEVVMTDSYIPQSSGNTSVSAMLIVAVGAIALSAGVMIGMKKSEKQ